MLKRAIYGLVANMPSAVRIAKAAKNCHVEARNFDRAEALFRQIEVLMPQLVIIDWDGCEAEAFKLLSAIRESPLAGKVASVGFTCAGVRDIQPMAERAGCLRVYTKTEFNRDLENILARFVQ